jgi:hypothetical protein
VWSVSYLYNLLGAMYLLRNDDRKANLYFTRAGSLAEEELDRDQRLRGRKT